MAKLRIPSLAAGCLVLLSAAPSSAEPRLSGSVGATTDYLYRGVTQSNGEAAVQAALQFDASPHGWTTGAWGSTVDVDRDGERGYEVDLHATHTWPLDSDWSAALGVIHREYAGERGLDYDHDELNASLSWQERVIVSVAWSPNTSFYWRGPVRGETYTWEISVQQPLNAQWSLFAGAGRHDMSDLVREEYTYWSAGLTFAWAALQLDLTHIGASDAARHLYGDYRGSRWTGALTVRF
jgi:uncharacterized protein (TIGR02001 family)